VLQDTLNTTQCSNDINTTVVKLPELSIVALRCPPEAIAVMDILLGDIQPRQLENSSLLQQLVLLPIHMHMPISVIRQRVMIFLQEGVDERDTAVPAIFQVFEGKTTILSISLLLLHGVLGPDVS